MIGCAFIHMCANAPLTMRRCSSSGARSSMNTITASSDRMIWSRPLTRQMYR